MARNRTPQDEAQPPLDPNFVIEFKYVPVKGLDIPIAIYQRPSSRRAINTIKEMGWDRGLQTVILVSGDTNRVLDGGHRVQAARELGIEQLPALVYHGLSERDEARYFVNLNRLRRPVGLRARHRAELLSGGAEAAEAQKVVEALTLKRAPLQTIHAANKAYPGVLLSLAPILNQMEGRTFSRDFIAGMTHFAATHPLTEETRKRLTEPGMHAAINLAIKQVMQEHMRAHNRVALPTDWSVKGEGVLLALNTRAARIPREQLIPA